MKHANPANKLLTESGKRSVLKRSRPTESPRKMSYLALDRRTAKPPFVGSNPTRASNLFRSGPETWVTYVSGRSSSAGLRRSSRLITMQLDEKPADRWTENQFCTTHDTFAFDWELSRQRTSRKLFGSLGRASQGMNPCLLSEAQSLAPAIDPAGQLMDCP